MRKSSAVSRASIAGVAGIALVISPGGVVHASGGAVAPAAITFVVKLELGVPGGDDSRACTGVLVRPRAVVTARDCLLTARHPQPGAAAALPVTARFRSGAAIPVVEVQPDTDPSLSVVVLARPAPVPAVALSTSTPAVGDRLVAAGFGRTATEWVPDQPHATAFVVQQSAAGTADLALDESAGTGLCRGDAGAPLLHEADGAYRLAAVATAAGQKGCLGSDDTSGAASGRTVETLAALPAATADPFDQLTLSPTDSGTPSFERAAFGSAVAVADFDKDGFPDVVTGAPGDLTGAGTNVASGSITVFRGGANGPTGGKRLLQTAFGAGDEAGDQFGATLATGDFNKDGYADLAVGSPGEQVGTIKAGSIAVFNGGAGGLSTGRGIDQNDLGRQDGAGDEFGKALTTGDFNGDGYLDLAVGSPGKVIAGQRSGEVIVLKGAAAGLQFGWAVNQGAAGGSNEAGDLFGAALAAGNVTGSTHTDLVVGAPGEAPASDPQGGSIYVLPGAAAGPVSGGVGYNQSGNGGSNEIGDRFGAALATGDFNKDGRADIAVGIPGEAPRDDPRSGTATIFPGGTTVGKGYPIEPRDVSGGDNGLDDAFGSTFAAGDVNGDGYADLLIGSPGRAGGAGRLHLFTGGAVSTGRPNSLTPSLIINQADIYGVDEAGDRFGAALAAGDLNKDGRADAVVGSPGEGAPGEARAGTVTTLSRVAGR
ncbi:trypsin-like serine protease [Actinoplanes sp. M2I2]|uniref:trypsin-like serine protease n=1 Tax=Actinoplanes sp. M2I2 TaxID=1734444 RepID=UPI0020220C9B|nr:trypsin-like serine protease [Actinoplanes sp. M2I2]